MLRHWILALGTLLLLGTADSVLPAPSDWDIEYYAKDASHYGAPRAEPLEKWEARLKAALRKMPAAKSAKAFASEFGLTIAQAEELSQLWLFVETDLGNQGREPRFARIVRSRYLALIASTARKPLVLAAAAVGFEHVGDCGEEDYDALLTGSVDRIGDGWLIARSGDCAGWYGKFLAAAPERSVPALIRLSNITHSVPKAELPVRRWLTGKTALAHVAEVDRAAVEARMNREYLSLLIDAGLDARVRAFTDELGPEMLDMVLKDGFPALEAKADGFVFTLDSTKADGRLRLGYAGALALAGSDGEASAALARVPGADSARASFMCRSKAPIGKLATCPREDWRRDDSGIVVLDYFLHHRGEDPYPIVETYFSSSVGGGGSADGISGLLRCKVIDSPADPAKCERLRGNPALFRSYSEDSAQAATESAALHSAEFSGQAQEEAAFATEFGPLEAAQVDEARPSLADRPAVEPEVPPFAKLPIPATLRGPGAPLAWPKDFAPLPSGFAPVRIGREGRRVAVISVSQNLDPVGEVSAGGYWVHLSDDSGSSWREPLYTGLAENFPYVVQPSSALPMFDGDALQIAVEVALLDTSSITYPPVGLRTLRREKDIYLRVPLSDLVRDSDGDGLTDIAAHHLLLDRIGEPGTTPFLVGSDLARCKGPASPERQAMVAILGKLFNAEMRAIIEPIDRPADAPLLGAWRGATQSTDRPVFIAGNPVDYACLGGDKLMIVYSEADIARMARFTPDFHAVSIGAVTYNRDHTRGFLNYSMGWAGGTMRLILIDGKWQFDEIGSWIT